MRIIFKRRLKDFFIFMREFGMLFTIKCYLLRIKSFFDYEKLIYQYIEKEYSYLIEEFRINSVNKKEKAEFENKLYVWSLWWQGEENAPEIVKSCFKSQKEKIKGKNLKYIIITKDNWCQYITCSQNIIEKVNCGKITLTHFSDILRAELLKKYGGLWIDATVYCTKEIELKEFSGLYTVKYQEKGKSLTLGRWSGFLIGAPPKNILFEFMSKVFNLYWEKHNSMIAYLLIDYIIAIAYNNFKEIKEQYDIIPIENIGLWDMLENMNKPYNEEKWKKSVARSSFWKLSYKEEFNGGKLIKEINGKETYWGHIWNKSNLKI